MSRTVRTACTLTVAAAMAVPAAAAASAQPVAESGGGGPGKTAVAKGYGGAVATVDLDATRAGIEVLRRGGNAVDAAVAAAAALGVTEPYSAGVGGGGFFVYYDARTGKVATIDGRETAPAAMTATSFTENGAAIPFAEGVTSGLGVGVPGTPATWEKALKQWGTISLGTALRPATRLAEKGFVVDETFKQQTQDNAARFSAFPATRDLFLPGGQAPAVGTVLKNPDLAASYRAMAAKGASAIYSGSIAGDIVTTVQKPPKDPSSTLNVRPGLMTAKDLATYTAPTRRPTRTDYRGLAVYSMAPPSSGGTTVGEALNILETAKLGKLDRTQAMHRYLEASGISFADRNLYVGDPAFGKVPVQQLLSDSFAKQRACLIKADSTLARPIAAGDPYKRGSGCAAGGTRSAGGHEGLSTTHLTTADKWGNVVSYTLTIEQTGGSGIVVPGRGFLLNNELTDFNFTDTQNGHDPNLPGPGKRPRSSMAPTIVLKDGKPVLALGSPGGATIITTVLQTLVNRLDLGMTLPAAVAAPRASDRNGAAADAEPGFDTGGLTELGHKFATVSEIGAVAAIEFGPGRTMQAVAEPTRRGGGSAMVVTSK